MKKRGTLGFEDSKAVFGLLRAEQRPLEEIVSDFTSIFSHAFHFIPCFSLSLLLQDKKMLSSTQRLIAFALLHQAYASQKPSANPFINLIISVVKENGAKAQDTASKYYCAEIGNFRSLAVAGGEDVERLKALISQINSGSFGLIFTRIHRKLWEL